MSEGIPFAQYTQSAGNSTLAGNPQAGSALGPIPNAHNADLISTGIGDVSFSGILKNTILPENSGAMSKPIGISEQGMLASMAGITVDNIAGGAATYDVSAPMRTPQGQGIADISHGVSGL